MRDFQIAFTGDFLNERGTSAFGDVGVKLLEAVPYVRYRFIEDLAPKSGDAFYWLPLKTSVSPRTARSARSRWPRPCTST